VASSQATDEKNGGAYRARAGALAIAIGASRAEAAADAIRAMQEVGLVEPAPAPGGRAYPGTTTAPIDPLDVEAALHEILFEEARPGSGLEICQAGHATPGSRARPPAGSTP